MAQPIVTVVGSFAVGMTIRTSHMPIFGETLLGSDFDMGPGGKGSNQAVGAARLDAEAHFAGIIGDDKLGAIRVAGAVHLNNVTVHNNYAPSGGAFSVSGGLSI